MDLFDLFAKLSLNSEDYEKGLEDAKKSADGFGSKLKNGFKTVTKLTTAALGTATAGVTAIVKQSVDAYADYEQLVGGVETLFGDAAGQVLANSETAFKRAGMSMNEYMETSIQSAAALINSLGGDQAGAAKLMDMSLTDMSDNVNKMGTSMEAVQNAYRGFSRGNFTMLDNLALGFAGSKEGMEELIKKAEEFSGVKYDISSYSDIVEAIHVVQTEMGITGTTAKEASQTISGSLAATKSAWQNLVIGISNENADFGALVDSFVESVSTAAGNIVPRIEQGLKGVGQLVQKLVPIIVREIPSLIENIAPPLIDAALALVESVVELLSGDLINNLVKSVPKLLKAVIRVIKSLARSISKNIKPILSAVGNALVEIMRILGDPQTISELISIGAERLMALANGIVDGLPFLIEKVPEIIMGFVDAISSNLPMILEVAVTIMTTLVNGIVDNLPMFLDAALQIVLKLVEELTSNVDRLVDAAIAIINALANGLVKAIPILVQKVPEIIGKLVSALIEAAPDLWEAAKELVAALAEGIGRVLETIYEQGKIIVDEIWEGIKGAYRDIVAWGAQVIAKVVEGFDNAWDTVKSIGSNIVNGIWQGIKGMAGWLWNKVSGWVGDLVDGVKDFLGISSPSKVFAGIGKFTAEGLGVGFGKEFKRVSKDIQEKMSSLSDASVDLAANLTSDMDKSLSGGVEIEATSQPLASSMNAIAQKLDVVIDNMGFDVVLDDGIIAGRVDKLLGRVAMRKARGTA